MKLKKEILLKFLLIFIFVFAFFLMIFSAKMDSQTTDEAIHLFSGLTYLTKNDFRLDPEHPPLLKELSALPILFFRDIRMTFDGLWDETGNFYYDGWHQARNLSEDFFYSWNNPEKLLFWGRLPFIFLTLILGYLAYYWTKKIYGQKAGIFAAFLTLLFPNILAHGRLINTDLGITLFIFFSVLTWGNFLKKPNFFNGLLAGISLGLVMAAKFTGLIMIPIFLALLILKIILDFQSAKRQWIKYLLGLVGTAIIAFLIVWLTYGFSIQAPPLPLGSLSNNIALWTNYQIPAIFDSIFDKVRFIMFPADFYKGMFLVLRHAASGHGSYLLGQISSSGWWYYFPVLIFYKTPIPIFIFLALSIVFWKKIRAKDVFDEILLIIPPIIFLVFSLFSKADLGIRHILPIFPFIFVFSAKSINLINFAKFKILTIIFLVSMLWYLISAIVGFPNYLAYFNEFAGGQRGGYRIVADSNLDWGQDIYRLKKYLTENKIEKIYIVYPWDGDVALRYYGINFEPLYPEDQNVKGPVVVSATYLQTEAYSWLKSYPFRQITPGLFLFNLD